jgi:hypothetical protein
VFKYIEQNNLLSTNNNSKHDNIRWSYHEE